MNSTSMSGPNGSDIIASGDDGYGLVKVVRAGDGEAWFGAHDYQAAVAMAEKLVQVTSDRSPNPMRATVVEVTEPQEVLWVILDRLDVEDDEELRAQLFEEADALADRDPSCAIDLAKYRGW